MKIILISSQAEKVRTLSLNSWAKGFLSVLLLGIPVATGTMLGVKIADGRLGDGAVLESGWRRGRAQALTDGR